MSYTNLNVKRYAAYRGPRAARVAREAAQAIDANRYMEHNVSYMKTKAITSDTHAFWRLKRLRELKGITLDVLAERTGLTKSYLSKVERGISVPSIATALKVADAFGVGVGSLFGANEAESDFTVVRRQERKPFGRRPGEKAGHRYEAITPGLTHGLFEAFVDHPPFQVPSDYKNAQHRGQEMVFVVSGGIEVGFPHTALQLAAGDCIVFSGQLPHRILSLKPKRAEILVIVTSDRSSGDGRNSAGRPAAALSSMEKQR
jgi:transcriptional regulator with XRE-family HTH domain